MTERIFNAIESAGAAGFAGGWGYWMGSGSVLRGVAVGALWFGFSLGLHLLWGRRS